MKKTVITILLFFAILAAPLFAQGPGPGSGRRGRAAMVTHRVEYLTTVLNLSAAQQQQATTIFTDAAASAKALRPTMKSAHENLATAVKSGDIGQIDAISAQIGNLMGQMTAIRAKAQAAFFQSLTPDQQAKMSQLRSDRPHRFGGPGPGPGGR